MSTGNIQPGDVCGAEPASLQQFSAAEIATMWPQASKELAGYARYMANTQAQLTAAQLCMAIQLANEAAAARKTIERLSQEKEDLRQRNELLRARSDLTPEQIQPRLAILDRLDALEKDVKRLKEGNLTPEEFQNLCHNLHLKEKPCTQREFEDGCRRTQEAIFKAGEAKALVDNVAAQLPQGGTGASKPPEAR